MAEKYTEAERLCDIIERDAHILMAMSKFGISLGFGDKTVGAVCREQEVDTETFLAVANFISWGEENIEHISLEALMSYLENAHSYFIDFCLPTLKRKLIEAISPAGNNELALLIMKFYDDYAAEVKSHMDYESREVFSYVRQLLSGHRDEVYSIDVFAEHHHSIHDKLKELKNILIRFLPQRDNNLLNAALFDIINCEHDLMAHCRVEDRIFVPAVRDLERELSSHCVPVRKAAEESVGNDEAEVSNRERDIIRYVALGMSNKEIADKLFISVNTVTTHRRNIAQKLDIHSSAGLALYAVINGILDINDM